MKAADFLKSVDLNEVSRVRSFARFHHWSYIPGLRDTHFLQTNFIDSPLRHLAYHKYLQHCVCQHLRQGDETEVPLHGLFLDIRLILLEKHSCWSYM